MSVKIGINGFGRIGKLAFKAGIDDPEVEFVAINHPSLTPEYAFKLAEADGYKLLSSVVPAMKDWSEGFNCKIGVYFFF